MAGGSRAELVTYFQELSLHGWPKVFSAACKSRKAIWFLICCLSFGGFIEFTSRIISSYNKMETFLTTKVSPVTSLRMPAITFCNTQQFIDHTIELTDSSIPAYQELPSTCSNYSSADFLNHMNQHFFNGACKVFMARSRNRTMAFNNYNFDISFPRNFSFVPNFWPCYKLNKNGHIIQTVGGERRGLKLILFLNETEKDEIANPPQNSHLMEYRSGIFIDVHDQQYEIGKLEGISLSPGFHTYVRLKKIISKRQRSPFLSNCYEDSDNLYVKAIPGKHTMTNCLLTCELNIIYERCGSVKNVAGPFVNKSLYPDKFNQSITEFNLCAIDAMKVVNREACDCRLPCEQIEYQTQVTYQTWPQSWELQILRPILSDVTGIHEKDIDVHMLRKHLLQVSIYFSDIIETVITEEVAYGIEKVISDFGGQMGMFMGASFLSFIEIIVIIYDIAKGRIKRNISPTNEHIKSTDNDNENNNLSL